MVTFGSKLVKKGKSVLGYTGKIIAKHDRLLGIV
jgi:hypothetical protein